MSNYVDVVGSPILGCLEQVCDLTAYASVREAIELVPRSQWRDYVSDEPSADSRLIQKIKNQGRYGTCNGHCVSSLIEQLVSETVGRFIGISAVGVYRQANQNPHNGTTIRELFDIAQGPGALPVDTPENREFLRALSRHDPFVSENHVMPDSEWTPLPAGYTHTAKYFAIEEAYWLGSWAEIVSAKMRGFCTALGRQGHAVLNVDLLWRNGGIYLIEQNSHGEDTGYTHLDRFDGGFLLDSEAVISQAVGQYGAWTGRTMKWAQLLQSVAEELRNAA